MHLFQADTLKSMFHTDFAYIPVCLGAWTYIKLPIPILHCTYSNIYTVYFICGGISICNFLCFNTPGPASSVLSIFRDWTASCIELLGRCSNGAMFDHGG